MKKVSIRIPVTPAPWQRPKTRVVKGWVKHYSPAKTKKYEQSIAEYYIQSTKAFKFEKDQALGINIEFGMPIPKSTPKSRKQAMSEGIVRHIKKPDIDNLTKSVLDALNGVAWEDDSQIVRLTASKEYSEEPYVYLYIYESVD